MTRNEAIHKMKEIFRSDVEDSKRNIDDFVDGLEALGLIKFDEIKPIDSPSMVIKKQMEGYFHNPMAMADQCINALMRAGYRIVRFD